MRVCVIPVVDVLFCWLDEHGMAMGFCNKTEFTEFLVEVDGLLSRDLDFFVFRIKFEILKGNVRFNFSSIYAHIKMIEYFGFDSLLIDLNPVLLSEFFFDT